MISGETMPCHKLRGILRNLLPNKLLAEKKITFRFSANLSKRTGRARSSVCCKHEQNKA